MRRRSVASVAGCLLVSGTACGSIATGETLDVRGDTAVRSHGAVGAWGPARAATELLRMVPHRPEEELADVSNIAALPDGGVVLFDAQGVGGPALREFDASGRYVCTLGRQGSGPGEYATAFVRLAVTREGDVLLHDQARNRVVRFREGEPIGEIRLPERLASGTAGTAFVARTDGAIVMNASLSDQARVGHRLFLVIDSTGALADSIAIARSWLGDVPERSYELGADAMPLRAGGHVEIRTDILGFLRQAPDGDLLLVQAKGERPRYRPEERAELQRIEEWAAAGSRSRREARTIPDRKPLVKDVLEDLDGRVWLVRTGEAVRIAPRMKYWDRRGEVKVSWADSVRLTGFTGEGELLGELAFPPLAQVSIVGGHAWAIVPGADDIPTLVKYRVANR